MVVILEKRAKNMKKAVIATGGKQYIVSEGETLEVELLGEDKKVSFDAPVSYTHLTLPTNREV